MYKRDFSAYEIAKIICISETTIYRILGRKKVKIRSKSEATKISLRKYPKKKPFTKNIEVPKTRKDFENEAEIVGIMLGDGHIHNKGYTIRLKVRELDFIKNFSNLVKHTYNLKTINKIYDYPCSFVHSKKLALRLIDLTNYNKEIPQFILNGSGEIKARFLRGFFDAEGSVDVILNRRQIVLTQNNKKMLLQIKKMLFDIGIQSKYVQKNVGSDKLIISLLENLAKYHTTVGFSIMYKQVKLRKAVNYLRSCKAHDKEEYWQVLRHEIYNKKSFRKSAKELNIHWETYRSWVYGMKMPCQIKKDIEYGIIPRDYKKLRKHYDFLSATKSI